MKVTSSEAPTSVSPTFLGKMGLPVKAAEEVTMSASINSMDWGSRLASLIFGTKEIQSSTVRKGTRQDTSHLGLGMSFMVISVMMPRVPSEPIIRCSRL